MNRFVQSLSKVAAAGILVAAMGVPGLALAAGTSTPGTSKAMTKPAAHAMMPAAKKTTKRMVAKATKAKMTKMVAEKNQMKWRTEVKSVQGALNRSGAKLRVDGIWGPKTRAALVKYQKAHGLKATGHMNKATRRSLKIS